MIKLVIFDLDGVLVDTKRLHFDVLNQSIREHHPDSEISWMEHLSKYDGLSTNKKLNMLSIEKGLPLDLHKSIWKRKQDLTKEAFRSLPEDKNVIDIIASIKDLGINVAVASNSIRSTVVSALVSLGVINLVDYFVSNESVNNPKPYPEMYWKVMTKFGVLPSETIIVEDSHVGRLGATRSGAHLHAIKDSYDLNKEKLMSELNTTHESMNKWSDETLNVLIPMAGAGSRFSSAGYTFPKPLIEVNGKPMIQAVVENLNINANYVYIVQQEHYDKYNLKQLLNLITPNCKIVTVNGLTEGAAVTTLLAREYIDNDSPLLMANSDQIVDWNSSETMYAFTTDNSDAGMLTFTATHPKWSFAKLGEDGFVTQVAEKNPISDVATVGVYFWKHGSDYVKYADQMISNNTRTNNEFYVCPVFNEAIADGKRVRTFHVSAMWGIGTPEDLNTYLEAHSE